MLKLAPHRPSQIYMAYLSLELRVRRSRMRIVQWLLVSTIMMIPVLAVVSAHLIFLSVRKSNVLSNIGTEPSNYPKI